MPPTPADIENMAERYARAWSSHSPEAVASFYEVDGRITINDGKTTVGRTAIAEVAKGFYDKFPDLAVRLDKVRTAENIGICPSRHGQLTKIKLPEGCEEYSVSSTAVWVV